MQPIDWTIISIFIVLILAIAIYVRRYCKSVADFLVANRCAGRYLLCISQGVAGMGAITYVASFELYYQAGFTADWWMYMVSPIGLLIGLSGWVIYRYRETRAMTMAQFFEMRYSKRFRVFCGIVAWLAGIINMGIYPAVTANFFLHFCNLPQTYLLFGVGFSTYATIMIIELALALTVTFLGGMIIVLVADFVQGIFCNIVFVLILFVLLFKFDWSMIISTLKMAPLDASLIHPFKTQNVDSFNFAYFVMCAVLTFYSFRAWQGGQGFSGAARNAHEAKMAGILSDSRQLIQLLLVMLLPVCVYTVMHNSSFSAIAESINKDLASVSDGTLRRQMLVPVAIRYILPIGFVGLFATIMLAAAIGTDNSYLHSWGSIFVQDVIMPFRKKSLTPQAHMWLLRGSIFFVAIFIFIFSLFFKQNDYIVMYFYLTGAIFIGGAGACIIGGLYWKYGSSMGAWASMIVGGTVAFTGGILRVGTIWQSLVQWLLNMFPENAFLLNHGQKFPMDGMRISFIAALCAIVSYVIFSLLERLVLNKSVFNLEKMLHRGPYALPLEGKIIDVETGLKAILPGSEFSTSDKVIYYSLLVWSAGWFIFFVLTCAYHSIFGTSTEWWASFYHFKVLLVSILGVFTTIWITVGGLRDLRELFKILRTTKRDTSDDGRVVSHDNSEIPVLEKLTK